MEVCRDLKHPNFLTNFKIVSKKENTFCKLNLECLFKLVYIESAEPASYYFAMHPSGFSCLSFFMGTLAIH